MGGKLAAIAGIKHDHAFPFAGVHPNEQPVPTRDEPRLARPLVSGKVHSPGLPAAFYLVQAQLPFAGRRRGLVKEHLGEVRAGREEKHRFGLAPGIDAHPGQLLAIGDADDPKRFQL